MDAYLTTPDKKNLLTPLAPLAWGATDPSLSELVVESEKRRQPFLGVGAALTDSSAWLLAKAMEEGTRRETLKVLFDPKEGNGFAVLRVCVGASDFAVGGSYTYCDTPDPTLAAFSIQRERAYLIPLLKEIKKIQPNLTLIASPWSAPAWMKTMPSPSSFCMMKALNLLFTMPLRSSCSMRLPSNAEVSLRNNRIKRLASSVL